MTFQLAFLVDIKMPWQPFHRKTKARPRERSDNRGSGYQQMETSFDDLLPRSASDGNLVRAPSERFLLQNFDHKKTYGTCNGSSSLWSSFQEHIVASGETLAGLALRYNITLQDLKLANKLWTNEGLFPGRSLKIPVIEIQSTGLDLSGSSNGSDTMSTDSQVASSSATSSRRVSSTDSTSGINNPLPTSFSIGSSNGSLLSLPSQSRLTRTQGPSGRSPLNHARAPPSSQHRASVEDLSDFLSKMDTSIAQNKKVSISLIKSSSVQQDEREELERNSGTVDFLSNNNRRGGSDRGGDNGQYDNIC